VWSEWSHVSSAFLTLAVAVDTSALPAQLRPYLPLLLDLVWKVRGFGLG